MTSCVSEDKVEFLKTLFPRNNMQSKLLTVAPPDGSRRYEAVMRYLDCLSISASYFVNNI
jgi:hypothetical protein